MIVYYVHMTTGRGQSVGFKYFRNRRDAERTAEEWRRANPGDGAEVECINKIETSKQGIVDLLNLYASHPDNG